MYHELLGSNITFLGEYNAYKCQIGINELYAQRVSKVDPCVTPCFTTNCFCTTIQTNVCRFQCDVYCLLVWRDRVRHLATDPVVMRPCPATGHYALLVNHPNKLNLRSWPLAYLCNKVHGINIFIF